MNPLQPGVDTNNPTRKTINTRSFFGPDTLGYRFFDTHRFGEYHPHFVLDGVPDDKNIILNSAHDLRSYTLGAPLMEDIYMKKDYFAVPLPCILPLNWEKWYKNPKIGDDVDDEVGTAVTNFWTKVAVFVAFLKSGLDSVTDEDSTVSEAKQLTACFRYWLINEIFYSNGNLLKSLGISGNPYFEGAYYFNANERKVSFDRIFDYVMSQFLQTDILGFSVKFSDGTRYNVYISDNPFNDSWNSISFRSFLALARDDFNFIIDGYTMVSGSDVADSISALKGTGLIYNGCLKGDIALDLRKVWAYQLSCAHFYTNDNVDFVYSAELYRELINYYVNTYHLQDEAGTANLQFTYNGVYCYYDALCGKNFTDLIGNVSSTAIGAALLTTDYDPNEDINAGILGYLCAAFSYRRSLRYKDYFTGARPRPLAVGDSNVSVNDSKVNVIDMASGFQKTRFWNAVSRARTGIKNYLREIFGSDLPYDMHDPMWLANTSDSIFGAETENTGEGQLTLANSVTSILRSNAAKYAFNFDVDVPCVIIGITFYDIPRVYSRATERTNFHANRFDDFNPFLQFVGDQVVTRNELGLQTTQDVKNFAYQLRHMEYKQRYDQCAGGFCENLPGYVFLADDERFSRGDGFISPDFIRSLCTELDKYYVSLTGFSLGSYFHFIVKNNNNSSASRPMALAPSIL